MTTQPLPAMHETAAESKLHLVPHQIILRPLVTEKGVHRSTRHNAYAFEVNKLANKRDVPYQSLIKVWLAEKVDAE